ncbi:HlyD family secretion protein [Lacisediminimonas profundi]|uniref:HlyD family secretion protein n=1 Tax=Lacisediminimonas profundi TaxID=2603856 RepID=UPI00124BBDF2|nr:HlyD family efflux transporter periplasmic adaptor subunit [Lacisediminimonas profundi]
MNKKFLLRAGLIAIAAAAAFSGWQALQPKNTLPAGLASGNGRMEAVEIDVAARTSGRIKEILVNEGDFVQPGQVLARMDTQVLEAQKREAQAQLERMKIGIETAQSGVAQAVAEKEAAQALLAQRQAELDAAIKRLDRTEQLATKGMVTLQGLDDDRTRVQSARAAVGAGKAQIAAVSAAISNARSQVVAARSAVAAAKATVERIAADIDDSELKSPREGRVQYRIVQPGEVLSGGGKVLNLIDLTDVYMTFFLPTQLAGRVALGADVRLVLDALPDYVIPAKVSFVADVAQFTPKTVETTEERQKLMFRIKARIDPELLRKHVRQVKTGLPGVAYVRIDPRVDWPAQLQIRTSK